MIRIFYKRNNAVRKVRNIAELDTLDNLIWIDLQNASKEEVADVEAFYEIKFQSRQEQLEIESSSRYFETDDEIIANSNFLQFDKTGNHFLSHAVSFILQDELLFTYRDSDLASFAECVKIIKASGKSFHTGKQIMATLLETGVDKDADLLESLARQITSLGKELALDRKPDETVIFRINSLQELTMSLRQNSVDKQRVLSAILKSREFEGEDYERLRIVIKDINSLIEHTNFNFERLEYFQNTFMSLVNIEQNKIIKIFTIASVIFMPPTLIASIFGMNFTKNVFPSYDSSFGFIIAISIILISSVGTFIFFKRKNWV